MTTTLTKPDVPPFDRRFFDGTEQFTRIGSGAFGGKAHGLLGAKDLLATGLEAQLGARDAARLRRHFDVHVPTLTVVTTDCFEAFMDANRLWDLVRPGETDHRIAQAFQAADLPVELLGDLYALIRQVHTPLAVRSSSLLEDALNQPFAGVYGDEDDPQQPARRGEPLPPAGRGDQVRLRLDVLRERAQLPPAHRPRRPTTGWRSSSRRSSAAAIATASTRTCPASARSYSFYRSGHTRPEDGVVNLAFGLGKTIVDGGLTWSYSPAQPRATPPYSSVRDLLRQTQVEFWAVNMGKPPAYDPVGGGRVPRAPPRRPTPRRTARCGWSRPPTTGDRTGCRWAWASGGRGRSRSRRCW